MFWTCSTSPINVSVHKAAVFMQLWWGNIYAITYTIYLFLLNWPTTGKTCRRKCTGGSRWIISNKEGKYHWRWNIMLAHCHHQLLLCWDGRFKWHENVCCLWENKYKQVKCSSSEVTVWLASFAFLPFCNMCIISVIRKKLLHTALSNLTR